MDIENWRSLRFLVRRYFGEQVRNGFVETKSEGAWCLGGGSSYLVLNRGDVWVLISRHMGEEHVELAFHGPPRLSDWYDIVEVLMATGVRFDPAPGTPPIPHRLRDKASALVAHIDSVERAVHEDRSLFLARLKEIRDEGIREGVAQVNSPRHAQLEKAKGRTGQELES